MNDLRPLKQALLDEYGSFSDRRIRNIDRGSTFIADDRGPDDYAADKTLFPWFCMMFVEVVDTYTLKVSLRGGVPRSALVTGWARQHCVEKSDDCLTFNVAREDVAKLVLLAEAFRSIVRSGAPRYAESAYKYVVPRTADALDRLHSVLAHHWA